MPDSPTRILLVRHGEVPGISPPAFRGRIDLMLTSTGLRQAEATRDVIEDAYRVDVAYASPLSRCMRTADIVAEPFGITAITLPEFTDMDYGAWQGLTYQDVQQDQPELFARWFSTPHLADIPGGETLYQAAQRVAAALRFIMDRHAGETVLLVGHDSVNRLLLLFLLDLPLSRFWHLRQDPCALNVMEHENAKGWTIHGINQTTHLIAAGLLI